MLNLVLIPLFSVWFLLSVLAQTKSKCIDSFKSKDLFKLIPNWRFFAPIPVRTDYHLEYRLLRCNNNITPWKKVLQRTPRNFWCFIWYPEKRFRKALNTSVRRIDKISSISGRQAAVRSYAYLGILYYLQNFCSQHLGNALQFRIVSKQDFASNRSSTLIFKSRWHSQY